MAATIAAAPESRAQERRLAAEESRRDEERRKDEVSANSVQAAPAVEFKGPNETKAELPVAAVASNELDKRVNQTVSLPGE